MLYLILRLVYVLGYDSSEELIPITGPAVMGIRPQGPTGSFPASARGKF